MTINKMHLKRLPSFFIGKKRANELITNFQKLKHPILSEQLPNGKVEVKSIWYNIDFFREIYEELIYLNASGIRVYLGSYDYQNRQEIYDFDVSGQMCLVMIPTYFNSAILKEQDLVIEDLPEFSNRPGSERYTDSEMAESELSRGYDYGLPDQPLSNEHEFQFPY